MNRILVTRVFPMALTTSVVAVVLWMPRENAVWFRIALGLLILNGLVFIWMRFRKTRNIEITNEAVIVGGIKIDRGDIQAWRVFRASSNGELGRYIELELSRVPPSSFGWRLAKLFEQLPSSKRCDRGIPLAREPRIVARLGTQDDRKDEIERALETIG